MFLIYLPYNHLKNYIMNTIKKTKRNRIKAELPIHTSTVEFRIKKIQAELGLTTFELKWLAIQNELKSLNK
jgi:hypothetical protein